MEIIRRHERDVRELVAQGRTHLDVARYLSSRYPGIRGLSPRNVRRFCREYEIHYRSRLEQNEVNMLIRTAITRAGHSYGRRTLQGLVRANGHIISQERIRRAMQHVAPGPLSARRRISHRISNPHPYVAHQFGEKIHLDQNEKLAMFGVVHVLAIDGYSRKICGLISIPRKNAITIYDKLFQPLLLSYGLWEQVRVDHGTEFALLNYVQQQLSGYRSRHSRVPVLRTTSRNNHRVERLWVEINQRINYPIKTVLCNMQANGELDLNEEWIKFCVSWVVLEVCRNPIIQFVNLWNFHCISGRTGGVPNELALNSCIARLPVNTVPGTLSAVLSFGVHGHHNLTAPHTFGNDPLQLYPRMQDLRQQQFSTQYPDTSILFQSVLHSRGQMFKQSLLYIFHLFN